MADRILVVDDEVEVVDFLRRGLVYKGYLVDVAYDGQTALDIARERPPDLVVLDVMMPEMDGLTVCQRLRAGGDVPIIMLTARDAVSDKIAGLDSGADDYVTKPFSFEELLARVRAALRRHSSAKQEILRLGDLTMNVASREVTRAGRPVELTAREFDLLEYLLRNAGRVVTKEQIFERIWGYDFAVESDAVRVYISYLREKLNRDGLPDLVHTVRGVGYIMKE